METGEAEIMDGPTCIVLCSLASLSFLQQESETPPAALPPAVMTQPPTSIAPRRRPMAFTIPGFQRGYPQGSLDPWWYGYNFGDNAAGYYGGGNYTRYYAYTRGFPSIGDFPGPVPGPVWTNDPKRTPYLHQMPMFTQRGAYPEGPVMTGSRAKNAKVSGTEPVHPTKPPIPQEAISSSVAKISISLPESARLLIEEKATMQTGINREFVSPELQEGVDYVYHLKAEWTGIDGRQTTREVKVALRAGQHHKVLFDMNSERVSVELVLATN